MSDPRELQEPHPVRDAQRRIAEVFEARKAAVAEARPELCAHALDRHILPVLKAVGWQGRPREIAEAMPHDTPVGDIATLSGVLARLGVETQPTELSPFGIRADHTPCLIVDAADNVSLVLGVEPDGRLRIHDPALGTVVARGRLGLAGEVRRLLLADATRSLEIRQREGLVWPLLRSLRGRVAGLVWQSMAINVLGLAVSLYVMFVYDKAIGTRGLDTLAMLALGALTMLAVEVRLRQRRAAAIAWIAARVDALIACNALASVLDLPLPMSLGAPLSAQITRFRQFEIGRELFSGGLATALLDLPFTAIFFALIFLLGGALGFVPVALAVVLIVAGLATSPVLARNMREMGEWRNKSDGLLVEITTRLRVICDDHSEETWCERASDAYRRYLSARFRTVQLSSSLQTLAQVLVSLAGVGVLSLGALEVMANTLSMGALIAIMAIVWRVLGPIQTVFLSLHRVRAMLQTVRQVEQLMKMKPERLPLSRRVVERQFQGAIGVANATLRHANRQDLALKAVSLTVTAGEFVAIAGTSGAGKSTLMKAILGLVPLQAGAIRIDDLDLRQLDPRELRHAIGYLPQEPRLFHGTVAQNLRLVAPDATQMEIVDALAAVGLPPDHPELPEGIDTRLAAARRNAMSPGVVQRIALARMFVRPWPILFFDEPSNHLDTASDAALMTAINRLKGWSTIIMITARPSHMRAADRVVVMHEGTITGQGKPDEIVPLLMSQAARPAA